MIIYGVALLSLCTLAGLFIGEILGVLLGVPANVGGVGIAMLLLIFVGSYLGPSPWSRCSTASAGRKPKAPRR